MNRTITVTVTAKGETLVETKGFAGGQCRSASDFIEKALGKRLGETLTPEFHQSVSQTQVNRQTE